MLVAVGYAEDESAREDDMISFRQTARKHIFPQLLVGYAASETVTSGLLFRSSGKPVAWNSEPTGRRNESYYELACLGSFGGRADGFQGQPKNALPARPKTAHLAAIAL